MKENLKLCEKIKSSAGLPWWLSDEESACQCRRHRFNPWSGKFPHAAEQWSPWVTVAEPVRWAWGTGCGAVKPTSHSGWARALSLGHRLRISEAHESQWPSLCSKRGKPPQREAHRQQQRAAPASHNSRKAHKATKAQSKINKYILKFLSKGK